MRTASTWLGLSAAAVQRGSCWGQQGDVKGVGVGVGGGRAWGDYVIGKRPRVKARLTAAKANVDKLTRCASG